MVTERVDIHSKKTYYRRNGNQNYMVICNGDSPKLPYQVNTIRHNKIEGLLSVQFFIEDGEYQYFYDISCKESLTNKMKQKKYTIREIRTILSDLYRCTTRMEDYLLDMNGLLLDPDYIFADQQNQYYFCYYPVENMVFEKSLEELFEYFMNRLDYQDETTIQLVYMMYQKARENTTPFSELMRLFCETPCNSNQKNDEEQIENTSKNTSEDTEYTSSNFDWDFDYGQGKLGIGKEETIYSEANAGNGKRGGYRFSGTGKDVAAEQNQNKEKQYFKSGDKKIQKTNKETVQERIQNTAENDIGYRMGRIDTGKMISYILDIVGGLAIAAIIWHIRKIYGEISRQELILWLLGITGIIGVCGLLSAGLNSYFEQKKPNKLEIKQPQTPKQQKMKADYSDIFEKNSPFVSKKDKYTNVQNTFDVHRDLNTEVKTKKERGFQEITFETVQIRNDQEKEESIETDDKIYGYGRAECEYAKNFCEYNGVEGTHATNRHNYENERDISQYCGCENKCQGYSAINASISQTRQNLQRSEIPATVVMKPQMIQAFHPVLISEEKERYPDIILKNQEMMIGKIRGIADICLNGELVSRIHARIIQDDSGCSIVDLGSTNGTYINGEQIEERQKVYLKDGDKIDFADVKYTFKDIPDSLFHKNRK